MNIIGSHLLRLAATGLAIQLSLTLLVRSLSQAVPGGETVAIFLATSIVYLIACQEVLSGKGGQRARLWLILLFALSFRLTVLQREPALSDDVYRYRWSGQVQLAGGSPYTCTPDEPRWAALRDEGYARISGKDQKFGYGPLWTLIERGMAATGASAAWWKLPAMLCDLGIIAALIWLLRLYGLPWERVAVYAWSPLAVLEFWQSGHNDAVMVLCLVLALCAAKKERWAWSFALLGLASMVKFWPALLLPLWLERSRRWKAALAAPAAMAPFLVWAWAPLRERADFIAGFLGGWRNNDSLFGAVLWLAGGNSQRAKLISLVLLGVLAMVVVAWRGLSLERGALAFIAGMLLISANVHPWYLTWALPLLAVVPFLPVLVWVCLVPLAYIVLIDYRALGEWNGSTPWRWVIYLPVFGCFLYELTRRLRRRMN